MGNIVPSGTADDIRSTAEEVIKTFTPLYLKGMGVAMVKAEAEARNRPANQFRLTQPPIPFEPLHEGYATKLGGVMKNWKKRYFVALNKKDNFDIKYYASDAAYASAPDKPKGVINLCWYQVKRCTSEGDKAANGEFSVKLAPWWSSDRRRTWVVRFDDEETLKKWIEVFQNAANKANAPLNEDPVLRAAFKTAYNETRWRLGEWGWYYYAAPEEKQLGMLVVDRCDRTCMREVYAKLNSSTERVLRPRIEAFLDGSVGAVVGAGWKSIVASIATQKPALEAKVREQVAPLLDKKMELMDKIQTSISSVINPAVEKQATRIVSPLTNILSGPLLDAFQVCIRVFTKEMSELITKAAAAGDKEKETWERGFKDFDRETYYSYGILRDAIAAVRNLDNYSSTSRKGVVSITLTLEEILTLLNGVELWQVERDFEDSVREVCRWALYTFKTLVKNYPTANKQDLLGQTVAAFVHDSKVRTYKALHSIFSTVILKPIHKEVVPTLTSMLEPIASLIPEAFAPLLDVNEMVETIIDNVVSSLIDAAIVNTLHTSTAVYDALLVGDFATGDLKETLSSKEGVKPLELGNKEEAPAAAGGAASSA